MLRLRLRSDAHARCQNGAPAHSTTGAASNSCSAASTRGASQYSGFNAPGSISPIASHSSGTLSARPAAKRRRMRSEEHTSELQSLMRISYAVFCLKKKTTKQQYKKPHTSNQLEATIAQRTQQ